MILKGIILVVICILCGITVLASLIIAVVKRRNRNTLSLSLGIAFLAIIGGISSAGYLSYMLGTVLMKETKDGANVFVEAMSEVLSSRFPESSFMDSIKSLQPTAGKIPPPFFYSCGFRDYYRMPLVYPYSMIVIDADDYASIQDESLVKNAFASTNSAETVLNGVTEFTFDRKHLLACCESRWDSAKVEYVVLDFGSKDISKFKSKAQMNDYLDSIGVEPYVPRFMPMQYYNRFVR
ncbi:hypothetical protein [Dysgonomonas macrotermitis]|uniref:Uncharacterized protein n=1 Tax=Dysgonomonas macrotermitis TaxID=1346286 RepID=A0A1M5FMP3_9BACT|nr:hypothetical protein [Dysgonomonas macrotermitis]SHF92775.1 hypothetical protein SAMN05444362_11250 [Dysgonomonas macrotermitis]